MLNKLTCGLLSVLICLLGMPGLAQDNQSPIIEILAKQNLALHSRPDFHSNVLSIFESGDKLSAFGRNGEGTWLQTPEGWVNARNIAADGDLMTLRQTAEAITLQASENLDLRIGPDGSYRTIDTLPKGQLTVAVGRNHDGAWLETLKGWIAASEVDFDGDIMSLPVSFASITVTASKNGAFLSAPTWEADVLEIFQRGSDAFAYERTEDADWVKTPKGWVHVSRGALIKGDLLSLPPAAIVSLQVNREVIAYRRPDVNSEKVETLQIGSEVLALSRSEDGNWLQIPTGWVSAEAIEFGDNSISLPATMAGIRIKLLRQRSVYVNATGSSNRTGVLVRGDEATAIGRNEPGTWLQTENGWMAIGIRHVHASYFDAEGDIMSLPITDGSSAPARSATASRPTATPRPSAAFDTRAMRTLITRHTDNIRILDIETAGNATPIEYDLKPWPFVPNESIADEVAFKIICAIRNGQQAPNTLKFIGHTHFMSEVGRKFIGPSVEMHISASKANRIVCRGHDPSDINWRRIASR